MSRRMGRSALVGALVAVAAAAFAPGALASINPSISLDQSAGTKAGATENLGMDLKFPRTRCQHRFAGRDDDQPAAWTAGQRRYRRRRMPDDDRPERHELPGRDRHRHRSRLGLGAADDRLPLASTWSRRRRRRPGRAGRHLD